MWYLSNSYPRNWPLLKSSIGTTSCHHTTHNGSGKQKRKERVTHLWGSSMSFSRRHSTGPSCWGDDRVPEEAPQPAKAFFYWNGSYNVKEEESEHVRKPNTSITTTWSFSYYFPVNRSVHFTFWKKTDTMKQHVATLITGIKKWTMEVSRRLSCWKPKVQWSLQSCQSNVSISLVRIDQTTSLNVI